MCHTWGFMRIGGARDQSGDDRKETWHCHMNPTGLTLMESAQTTNHAPHQNCERPRRKLSPHPFSYTLIRSPTFPYPAHTAKIERAATRLPSCVYLMNRGFLLGKSAKARLVPSPAAQTPSSIDGVTTLVSKTSITSQASLPPEILRLVVQHLNPARTAELAVLLVIQRYSQYGWKVATPIIYRDIVVRDWKRFLRLPEGISTPFVLRHSADTIPFRLTAPRERSLQRRREALTYCRTAIFHSFPIIDTVLSFLCLLKINFAMSENLTMTRLVKVLCPALQHVQITKEAWKPFANPIIASDYMDPSKPTEELIHLPSPGVLSNCYTPHPVRHSPLGPISAWSGTSEKNGMRCLRTWLLQWTWSVRAPRSGCTASIHPC